MPEIAEVARLVHFLRLHLVGKKIAKVTAPDDAVIFGKVGTTGPEFEAAVRGKKVVSAGSQGKYFWITLDKAPHVVMHLGMTGWIHIRGEQTAYTRYLEKSKDGEADQWPPKFTKFHLETDGKKKVEVAFTDPRRFGRIRVVDCPGPDIRKHSPLVENGPDPVVDLDVFTEDYLRKKMTSRHVPVKALLLDQATISGIGNWVGDEVLFHARMHPEQYCDEFSDKEAKRLFESVRFVCQTAVDKLGDSDQFPDDWLFNHRWGKGEKKGHALPNGEKLAFVTVGGRTSCFAPGLQKKTGNVPVGIKEELIDDAEPPKKASSKRKSTSAKPDEKEDVPKKKAKTRSVAEEKPKSSSRGKKTGSAPKPEPVPGRRRSGRLSSR